MKISKRKWALIIFGIIGIVGLAESFLKTSGTTFLLLVLLVASLVLSFLFIEHLANRETLRREREKVEEELKQANLVVENSPAILIRWKNMPNYPIFMVSANINQFGYSQEELVSGDLTHADIVHPEDLERMNHEIESYTSNYIDRYHQQYRIITKTGEVRWIDDLTRVIRDRDRKILEYQGILLDITDRKKAEEALRESEARLKSIIAVSNTGAWEYHHDTGHVWCSDEYFTMLGRDPDKYDTNGSANISESWLALLHPDDQEAASAHFFEYLKGGSAGMYENHFRMRHRNGTWVWIWSRGQTVKHTDGSLSHMTIGTHINITKIKEMEFSLYKEKEQFKTTLISIGDGVISTDIRGNVKVMNKVSEQLTGWTQEEAIDKPIETIFSVLDEVTREPFENPVREVLETGKIVELTNHPILLSKEGIERPIEDSAAPIKDENGETTGVVLVFRDFTEKKKSQKEIEYLSFHDHLTGLYNRRFFETEMKRLDTERNLPITILLGDVNGLKLINDSFGHGVGDELIVKAANTLKESIRGEDILARIGGDEYALLLPKTDAAETEELVRRVKGKLKKKPLREIEVSVSFGWETKHHATESLTKVFKKAEDKMYKQKLFEGPSMRGNVIHNIITTINEKRPEEKNHSEKVASLCVAMGKALGMDGYDLEKLKMLGLFHDIGKIAISDSLLSKREALTEMEYNEICRHAEIGYRILSTVNDMAEIAEYVLHHHERWDGKGYPKGLKGEEIPLPSRICFIADAYDMISNGRNQRSAKSPEDATEELKKNAGTQFDPELVTVFLEQVLPKYRS
ncbi:PAS domain S-box-containing protein/diguanylate cyclase (GGDEF) domain-containing protein [Tindallia magadiensis]|uniref:PAS domain S-box-containing protein/diguanylate cyclase (GGDEF) domain-containing protein n=1 Tax=Tindallia magadiensis TaxID=69895 RepID=A0A1I3GDV0_9FIRM|nr:PAS domain-containing protein [Tindallia magadiensis]SFI21639.1 PAS domain S-box-containing protein/diguanylate cyclase (GGDEF) domain-containing protein [Tindallia magadiensis]